MGDWTVIELDSAKRPDEPEAEYRLRMLLKGLQCLAADGEILLQAFWFPGPNYIADDLAEEFAFRLELAERCVKEGLISKDMFEKARAVDAKLDKMSGSENASLWTDEAVRTHEEWSIVRRLAREALGAMGYDLEPPPPWWKTEIVELRS